MAYFRSGISNIQKFRGDAVDVADLPSPIASFQSNVSGVKLDSLKVLVEAVQSGSGTPSPDNVRPITGWSGANVTRCGVNVWGGSALLQSFINANISGFTYDTTAKTLTYYAYAMTGKNILSNFKFKENTQYTLILRGSNALNYNATNLRVWYSDGTNSLINFPQAQANIKQTCVFTSSSGKTIDRIVGVNASGTVTLYYDECGLFEGILTADDFSPYNGNTYTIAFGDTYYGCELDVTNGVLRVVKKGRYVDSELSISYDSTNQRFFVTLPDMANNTSARNKVILCSTYENKVNVPYEASWDSVIYNAGGDRPKDIAIHDRRYTTVADFVTYTSQNCFIVYPLATPIEIQLTPQQIEQLAENNVFADCGDVEEVKKIQISQIGG